MARRLRTLLGIAIVLWLVATLASRWRTLAPPAFQASPAEVAVALGAAGLALVGLSALFVAELKALGLAREGDTPLYVRLWFQGYFYRYVPGKVMLVAERVRLGERLGIPRATSVVLVLWETVLLLGGAAVVAPLAAGRSTVLVCVLCFGVLVAFLPLARVGARAFGVTLPDVPARTQLGLVTGYALVWLLLGVSFAATCRWFASGEEAGLSAALAFVAAYVAGLVAAVAPAGIGVREAVLVVALGTEDALAMALASRIVMTAVELALVGLSRLAPELAADGR